MSPVTGKDVGEFWKIQSFPFKCAISRRQKQLKCSFPPWVNVWTVSGHLLRKRSSYWFGVGKSWVKRKSVGYVQIFSSLQVTRKVWQSGLKKMKNSSRKATGQADGVLIHEPQPPLLHHEEWRPPRSSQGVILGVKGLRVMLLIVTGADSLQSWLQGQPSFRRFSLWRLYLWSGKQTQHGLQIKALNSASHYYSPGVGDEL